MAKSRPTRRERAKDKAKKPPQTTRRAPTAAATHGYTSSNTRERNESPFEGKGLL